IYTFTDGVTEAMNKEFELYSEERLELLLKENYVVNTTEIISKSFENVKIHADGELQSDDITILAIKYF
ncbi:MAG: SpoIIE family protein phosphatase, partial [Ignavibacteria bacterium]|nr:SpoIIE family protein phosphatase [Ignavibacteria bacterium]